MQVQHLHMLDNIWLWSKIQHTVRCTSTDKIFLGCLKTGTRAKSNCVQVVWLQNKNQIFLFCSLLTESLKSRHTLCKIVWNDYQFIIEEINNVLYSKLQYWIGMAWCNLKQNTFRFFFLLHFTSFFSLAALTHHTDDLCGMKKYEL